MPALARVKKQAMELVGKNNEKQQYTSQIMRSTDNDGKFPPDRNEYCYRLRGATVAGAYSGYFPGQSDPGRWIILRPRMICMRHLYAKCMDWNTAAPTMRMNCDVHSKAFTKPPTSQDCLRSLLLQKSTTRCLWDISKPSVDPDSI